MAEDVKLERVKNIGGSVVDIADGRTLVPGDYADDVNLADPHNDRLVLAGLITAVPDAPTAPEPPHAHKAGHKADQEDK